MNIFDYLRTKNINLHRVSATGEHASPCPACGGKDRFRSFENRFFCRGCYPGGGDLIDLVKMVEGVDYLEACQIIGKEPAPLKARSNTPPPDRQSLKVAVMPSGIWQGKAAEFVSRSHAALLKNDRVLTWLRSQRHITMKTVTRFKIGWNPTATNEPRAAWGLPEDKDGTGQPLTVWLASGLVIPCLDHAGRLIRVKVRRPEGLPRYALVPGSSTAPAFFGSLANDRPDSYILVESELDAILLQQQAGDLITAVSTGGTNIRPDTATVGTMQAGRVSLISFDSDDAGMSAGALMVWKESLFNFKPWYIPAKYGKDHTEASRAGLNLRAWLMAGLTAPNELQERA